MNVREQYERLASSYDERWQRYVHDTLSFLIESLRLKGNETVLDVACGTGALEQLLIVEYPELHIVGVDISEGMLSVAEEKLASNPNVIFRQCVAERLPFDDGCFDLVVTANAFHYFEDPMQSLREAQRVLKPRGRIVVLDWCKDFLICRICDKMLKVFDPAYKQCYGMLDLREMLTGANFRLVREKYVRQRLVWGLMLAEGTSLERPRKARFFTK